MRGGFASPQPHYTHSHYQQQQQQQQHYPHQPLRTPSSSYAQPLQVHHQHMVPQQILQSGTMELGEDAK